MSGSVPQNPVVLLLEDVFVRISASAASRTSCARSLYEDLLCKMSESGCLYEEPLGPLVQELCMRISCACARCSRSPPQGPVGALVQDRCMRIFVEIS